MKQNMRTEQSLPKADGMQSGLNCDERRQAEGAARLSDAAEMDALQGHWVFEALELPASGIRREMDRDEEYAFDFNARGEATVHLHGRSYFTRYHLQKGFIRFDRAEAAALKLFLKGKELRMHSHLGAELIFQKTN